MSITEAGGSELVRRVGSDGKLYVVRPTIWTLQTVKDYWERFTEHEIFSDDFPPGYEGFEFMVLNGGGIWFDIIDVAARDVIGLLYFTEMVPSATDNRFVSATWHGTVWDAKASTRLPIAREAIKRVVERLQIHRLEVKIPLKFGGAIRVCKRIGFVEEGRMRSARRLNGEWWDVLLLSALETEVAQWDS